MKGKIFIAFFVLAGIGAQAQTLQQKYENAKILFDKGNYGLARESFKSLSAVKANNPYAELSSFFFALSSYHEGHIAYARDMLLQMKSRNPGWENVDEANYWLTKIYFENGQNDKALATIASISDKEIMNDAVDMKAYFLGLMPEDSLKTMLQRYPSDGVIAGALADRIIESPITHRDNELLDELISEYKLDKSKYETIAPEKSVKKDHYQAAVILPFMVREYSNAALARKNFVYEIFEGIKLAQKELRDAGIDVRLYAYDSRKDSLHTKRLLASPEMKGMDLIIGPISSETIDVVSSFSYANRINMINPVSTNSQIIGRNPYSLLFLSSLETQARQAARFAAENFGDQKTAAIFYGVSFRDSVLAHTYREAIEEEGFAVTIMQKVEKQQGRELFDLFNAVQEEDPENPEEDAELALPKGSLGHIYAATDSDDEMIASYLISALETRGEYIKMIGHEEWLDFSFIIPEQLERLQVHLVAPTFIDYSSTRYKRFRNDYLTSAYTLPGKFSSIGYDMMKFVGTMLEKEGMYFQVKFEEMGFTPGFILPGYRFDHAQDNQNVPVIRFIDSELVNVNMPNDHDGKEK